MTAAVNTKTASRRTLRFQSIDELLLELDQIEAAARHGTLQTTGNWTAGQILSHVAAWIEYGYDGYPVKPPIWPVRVLLRFVGRRMLKTGMPAGVRIPGVPQGTVGMDEASIPDATNRLRRALQRMQSGEEALFHSPAFGPLNHEDRILLNLRHAELHLGFMTYPPR